MSLLVSTERYGIQILSMIFAQTTGPVGTPTAIFCGIRDRVGTDSSAVAEPQTV